VSLNIRVEMARIATWRRERTGWRLRNSADAVELFCGELASQPAESFRVAHLDAEGRLLGLTGAKGQRSSIDLPIADIVRDAVALGARALVLAHNHPGGDPAPSPADKATTRRLAEIARGLEIRVIDHLIFAGERFSSFRQLGLL
jgi:DNA repair protein RadC